MGKWGVGMPAALKLERFGELLHDAFGTWPYQVGSSLQSTEWRDVDVRLILHDDDYAARGFGDPARPQENARWVAYTLAFATLGREITGLPIDFQIQQQSQANAEYPHGRNALGIRRDIMRMAQSTPNQSEQ